MQAHELKAAAWDTAVAADTHRKELSAKARDAGDRLSAFCVSQLYQAGYKPRPERLAELQAEYKDACDAVQAARAASKAAFDAYVRVW